MRLFLKLFANKKIKTDFDFSKIESVLIRPLGWAIGDAIIFTAIAKQLKEAYPGIRVGILKRARNEEVFENNPYIDKTVEHSFLGVFKERKKWRIFLDVSPNFTTKNILFDYILAPEATICFDKTPKSKFPLEEIKSFDCYALYRGIYHTSELLKATPLASYINFKNISYTLPSVSDLEKKMEKVWEEGKTRVLFNASGTSGKKIPKDASLRILKGIKEVSEAADILILDNPENRELLAGVVEEFCGFAPPTTVREMFALCKSAHLIVTVDTALVHIACAFNVRLVGVYANYPLAVSLFKPLEGGVSDYILGGKVVDNSWQIEELDTDKVIAAAKRHLEALTYHR